MLRLSLFCTARAKPHSQPCYSRSLSGPDLPTPSFLAGRVSGFVAVRAPEPCPARPPARSLAGQKCLAGNHQPLLHTRARPCLPNLQTRHIHSGRKKENHRQFVRALADNSDRNVRSWGRAQGCRGNVIDSDRSLMTDPLPLPGARLHLDTLKFSLEFQGKAASAQQGKKGRG